MGFPATMAALTPARTTVSLLLRAGIPVSRHFAFQSFHPQPPDVVLGSLFDSCSFSVTGLQHLAPAKPSYSSTSRSPGGTQQCCSGLRALLAVSPQTPGRNGFALLRTDCSPPAALHPASRRRSCSRLHTEHVRIERTCTAPTKCACRRTSTGFTRKLFVALAPCLG